MKAKFIKHKNPREALGLDPLSKRDFKSMEEFVDWLYKYMVPNFYNMPNGPDLYALIKKKLKSGDSYMPGEFYNYIRLTILPEVKINGKTELQKTIWFPQYLREKYPF